MGYVCSGGEVASVQVTKFSQVMSDGSCPELSEMWGRLDIDAAEAQHCADRSLVDFKKLSDPSEFEHHSGAR